MKTTLKPKLANGENTEQFCPASILTNSLPKIYLNINILSLSWSCKRTFSKPVTLLTLSSYRYKSQFLFT